MAKRADAEELTRKSTVLRFALLGLSMSVRRANDESERVPLTVANR